MEYITLFSLGSAGNTIKARLWLVSHVYSRSTRVSIMLTRVLYLFK